MHTKKQIHLLSGIALAFLAILVWTGLFGGRAALANSAAGDPKAYGILESAPEGGVIGLWVIGGVTYEATAITEFEANMGPFVTGACVKVEYSEATTPFTALKMQTEIASDCNGGGGATTPEASETPEASRTPEASQTPESSRTPEASETPGGDEDVKGIVETMPSPGLVGIWKIGGVEYNATAATHFEQNDGPLVVGACVQVEYLSSTTPRTAVEIKTEDQEECSGGGNGTPSPTGTPTTEAEVRGRVDSFPANLVGDWVVNGVTYSATNATEFKEEHGAFGDNVCVKIHYDATSTPFVMREIETEHDFRCDGAGGSGGDDDENELYGVLQSFPDGFIGPWNVGGVTVEVDASTELDAEHGPFEVGVTVKVHFRVDANGVNHAREIETKFAREGDGHDDDGNGSVDGAEGHAYGLLESFPADKIGVWKVSGVEYNVNASTELKEKNGAFAVDARVKVEYYLDANGNRIAHEIETTDSIGDSSSPDHFKVFGFVEQMPAGSFMGTWVINNTDFEAGAGAKFEEEHGILGLGAYVAVEYSVQNDVNVVHEIESHVPPGAGSDDRVGEIESIGSSVAAASLTANAAWKIAGVNYTVNAATNLKEVDGDLVVGATALVNSYTAADGTQVATQIRTVVLDQTVLLPIVLR
ncbi:MAG: DUF5666 domain-containing protein [Caldilineaceae bacterium]